MKNGIFDGKFLWSLMIVHNCKGRYAFANIREVLFCCRPDKLQDDRILYNIHCTVYTWFKLNTADILQNKYGTNHITLLFYYHYYNYYYYI